MSELSTRMLEALDGRGHTDREISRMSADEMFDEYCAWELGDPSWGRELRHLLDTTRAAVAVRGRQP